MAITKWLPGLLTWVYDNSSDPGMQKLRLNKDQTHDIARKLLDSKRREVKAGTARKDIMSLLGLLVPSRFCLRGIDGLSTPVKASDSQRQDWRLSDEEIIPQVR